MSRLPSVLILFAILAMAGCATPPTFYQPAGDGRYGFSEEQIDAETWRVRFAGNSATDRGRVEDYLLYRSAEIAAAAKADGFIVLKEDVEKDVTYYGTTHHSGYGYPYFWGHHGYHRHSHFGVGLGTTNLRPVNSYTAYATIRLFKDLAPEGRGEAYDAAAILRVMAPKIVRPPAT